MMRLDCTIVAVIALTACTGPATAPSQAPAAVTSAPTNPSMGTQQETDGAVKVVIEAFFAIYGQYVEPTPTRPLLIHALQSVERRFATSGIRVAVSAEALTITHQPSAAPSTTLTRRLTTATTRDEGVPVIADTLTFLHARSGRTLDELKDALVRGLIEVDTQGYYLDKQSYREMQGGRTLGTATTGLEVTLRDGVLTVVAPIDETPAFRAGFQPGDRIVKINGVSTADTSLPDALRRMRGSAGTKVTFTVIRDGWSQPQDIEVIREHVHVPSVRSQNLGAGAAYIALRHFRDDTRQDLEQALAMREKDGMKGLILDVRNNPGGVLTAAVEAAEQFLDNGKLVVYTQARVRNQNLRFSAHTKKAYPTIPIVVLVNRGTGAGAEIVAAALQDWGRTKLIGTQTLGDSSIQTMVPLSDGSALRLTTARWFTPKGRSVHGKGLTPDILVDSPDDPRVSDTALATAVAHLRSMMVP